MRLSPVNPNVDGFRGGIGVGVKPAAAGKLLEVLGAVRQPRVAEEPVVVEYLPGRSSVGDTDDRRGPRGGGVLAVNGEDVPGGLCDEPIYVGVFDQNVSEQQDELGGAMTFDD